MWNNLLQITYIHKLHTIFALALSLCMCPWLEIGSFHAVDCKQSWLSTASLFLIHGFEFRVVLSLLIVQAKQS